MYAVVAFKSVKNRFCHKTILMYTMDDMSCKPFIGYVSGDISRA